MCIKVHHTINQFERAHPVKNGAYLDRTGASSARPDLARKCAVDAVRRTPSGAEGRRGGSGGARCTRQLQQMRFLESLAAMLSIRPKGASTVWIERAHDLEKRSPTKPIPTVSGEGFSKIWGGGPAPSIDPVSRIGTSMWCAQPVCSNPKKVARTERLRRSTDQLRHSRSP
jgi:hypothetical protein